MILDGIHIPFEGTSAIVDALVECRTFIHDDIYIFMWLVLVIMYARIGC